VPGGYSVQRLERIPTVPDTGEAAAWHPLQHYFRLTAFGANAFVAAAAGVTLIHEHDEVAGGHEELYAVLAGSARFTLDGEDVDLRAVAFVAVRDPGVRRSAVSTEPGTIVLALGAVPRADFVSTWNASWFERVPQI
jgi:hypothetical protein